MTLTKPKIPDEERTISLTADGLGPWSHSKLKSLRKCPLQFYLKYVLKVKLVAELPPNIQTETGKAAHKILELILMGKSVKDAYAIAWKEYSTIFTPKEWEDNLLSVEFNIDTFESRIKAFEAANDVVRTLQELRIGITKDYKPTGFFSEDVWFRGVIDLAIQLRNRDVVFIDHKFGLPLISGIRHQEEQLNTYKVLFHFGIENITGAQAGIHFIKEGDIILGEYHSKAEIETSLRNRIECSIDNAVDSLKEIGYFKHLTGSHCQWCDFKDSCKTKQLLSLEKDTKKWFQIRQVQ